MKKMMLLFIFFALFARETEAQKIEEILANPPSTDGNNEYVELSFPASASVGNYAFLVIEGDTKPNAGTVDKLINLSSYSVGTNGLLLLVANAGDPYTAQTKAPVLGATASGNIENGANTFMLVKFTSATDLPTETTDLDVDDNGTLELLNANIQIVHSFGVKENTASNANIVYTTVFFDGIALGYTPDAFVRNGSEIIAGDAIGTAPNFTFDPVNVGNRKATLTPGGANPVVTAVDVDGVPNGYELSAAYPNPFNPTTNFTLTLAQSQEVQVAVYNVLGQQVALLHQGNLAAGSTTFHFDAHQLPSGLYLYRATGRSFQLIGGMNLVK